MLGWLDCLICSVLLNWLPTRAKKSPHRSGGRGKHWPCCEKQTSFGLQIQMHPSRSISTFSKITLTALSTQAPARECREERDRQGANREILSRPRSPIEAHFTSLCQSFENLRRYQKSFHLGFPESYRFFQYIPIRVTIYRDTEASLCKILP